MKAVSVFAERRFVRTVRLAAAVAIPTEPELCPVVTDPSMREVVRVIAAS
jgi:hypothetical protein